MRHESLRMAHFNTRKIRLNFTFENKASEVLRLSWKCLTQSW